MTTAVRLYEPISLLFPETSMRSFHATIPPPSCVLCGDPASPPARLGWLSAPDRRAVFSVCGSCSDCADSELEAKIVARLSATRRETADSAATKAPLVARAAPKVDISPQSGAAAPAKQGAWAARAAKEWVRPLTARVDR
jgi:hypothetical protein